MSLLDGLLNLVGLLLWIQASSSHASAPPRMPVASLLATLQRPSPGRTRRRLSGLGLMLVLAGRVPLYGALGTHLEWEGGLSLGAIVLSFRPDAWAHMVLYSLLSFGRFWLLFLLWLVLLHRLNRDGLDTVSWLRVLRRQGRWIHGWPGWLSLLLPLLCGGVAWIILSPALVHWNIIPAARSAGHLLQQAMVLGLATYLGWTYLLAGLLFLHFLNGFIFLGSSPFWAFVNTAARRLLRPLAWLPLHHHRMDFTPAVGIAMVFLAAELGAYGLTLLYQRLPL